MVLVLMLTTQRNFAYLSRVCTFTSNFKIYCKLTPIENGSKLLFFSTVFLHVTGT